MLCGALASEKDRQIQVHNSFSVPTGQLVVFTCKTLKHHQFLACVFALLQPYKLSHKCISQITSLDRLFQRVYLLQPKNTRNLQVRTPLYKAPPKQAA